MIFRSLATLAFCGGGLVLIAGLTLHGEAPTATPEARHMRDMKCRADAPASYVPYDTDSFLALPHYKPLGTYAPLERRGVSMIGWVQRELSAGDGDMHLELAERHVTAGGADSAYVTAEITPLWRHRSPRWSYEALSAVFRPNDGTPTPWDLGPRRVRVSGWLMYDYQYDHPSGPWSLAHGSPRVSGWEIHPVTRIEAWDDAKAAFTEVTP